MLAHEDPAIMARAAALQARRADDRGTVAGYESVGWISLLGPRGLPEPIVARIAQDVSKVLEQPEFRARLADQAFTPTFLDPRAFTAFIVSETEKWRRVVQAANVKVD